MYYAVFGLWSSPGSSDPTPPSGGADDNVRVAVRAMKQTAVYWEFDGVDEFGQPTYKSPVAIECRWEEVNEEFITASGDRELSKAKLIVDRDIAVKGQLYLGDLDSSIPDDPEDQADAWEIRCFKKTPDFKGSKYLREVYL